MKHMRAPKPVGRPALDIAGGVVLQPLNRLTGLQGRMLYADMSRDPVLSGLLLAVRHAAAQVEWSWEPPEQGGSGELGLIEEAWMNLRPAWPDVLNAVLQEMLTYGFTLYEPVYKLMNNRVVWDTFSPRHPSSICEWRTDPPGSANVVAAVQRTTDPHTPEMVIPIQQLLHFRTGLADASPEGRSALLGAVEPWYRKTNISEIESIGVERDLAGIPVFQVPGEWMTSAANPQERAVLEDLKETGRNLRISDNTCVIIPKFLDPNGEDQITFKLLEAPGTGQRFDTSGIILRLNNEMAMSLLGDWLMLGHEKVGTQALSVSKIELWISTINAWLDRIATVVTEHGASRLLHLNGFDGPPAQLAHTPIRSVDLGVLGQYVAHMSAAGLLTADEETENTLRSFAELPDVDPGTYAEAQEMAQAAAEAALNPSSDDDDREDPQRS